MCVCLLKMCRQIFYFKPETTSKLPDHQFIAVYMQNEDCKAVRVPLKSLNISHLINITQNTLMVIQIICTILACSFPIHILSLHYDTLTDCQLEICLLRNTIDLFLNNLNIIKYFHGFIIIQPNKVLKCQRKYKVFSLNRRLGD